MIISRAEIRSAVAAYKSVKRSSTSATVPVEADSFVRSEAALALVGAWQVAGREPFYREDLVNDLQRRISEGKYYVPSEDIVDRLLGRLIVEAAAAV